MNKHERKAAGNDLNDATQRALERLAAVILKTIVREQREAAAEADSQRVPKAHIRDPCQ